MFFTQRLVYSLSFFVLCVTLVAVVKPTWAFDADGRVKRLGVGDDATVASIGVVVILLAVLTMFGFSMIDLVYAPPG